MEKKRIEKEMRELELKIHYHFNDISWLAKAMGSIKIEIAGQGKNGSEYSNEGLATVGDTMLKSVIADKLFRNDGIRTKGGITAAKSDLENNSTMHKLMLSEGLINYSYNDLHFYKDANIPDHEKVVCKEHDPYVEAIVGAIYYDSNYDTTKRWILKWLLPLLEKYKQETIMKVALIGCTKQKRKIKSQALNLYDVSSYFVKRRNYAERVIQADKIFILSALHELLPAEQEVEPYNICLRDLSRNARKIWAEHVLNQINSELNKNDEIFILSGSDYSKDLYPLLISDGYKHVTQVLNGKGGIGSQMKWLDEEVAKTL